VFTCKQVARRLAERDYTELPWLQRGFLKLHVILCAICGRYHRDVMRFQDGIRPYREGALSRNVPPREEFRLRESEREGIRRALAAAGCGEADGACGSGPR
jgi:hypothetical protein